MKTSFFIVPAIITLASNIALADDHKKFDEVDLNKDGKLSVSEARVALPGLKLEAEPTAPATSSVRTAAAATGENQLLTRGAVEEALPQISFEDGDENDPITEEEYDKIVEELEERGMTADTSTATATGAAASSTRPAASADRETAADEEDRDIDLNNDGDDDIDVDVDLGDDADDADDRN